MSDTNFVLLKGRIGNDPEIRTAGNNTLVARIRVVTNKRRWTNGAWAEVPTWHTVKAFGSVAEALDGSLRKGSRVIIHGELNVYNYIRQDQSRGCDVEIIAETIAIDGAPPRRHQESQRQSENHVDRRPAPRQVPAARSAPPVSRQAPPTQFEEQVDDLPPDPYQYSESHISAKPPPLPAQRPASYREPSRRDHSHREPELEHGAVGTGEDPFDHYERR